MISNIVRPIVRGVGDWAFRAKGRHRAGAVLVDHEPGLDVQTRAVLPEEELLAGWPAPERPKLAAVVTSFDDCPTCGPGRAGSLNKDGWLCGECLTTVPAGGAS